MKAIIYALLAAAFYAINVPFSKLLLNHVGATTMAARGSASASCPCSAGRRKAKNSTERICRSFSA